MNHEQGSPEWFEARLGKVTASRVIDIMPGPRGYRASRKNYMAELLCERLTGQPTPTYQNDAMRWGTETEPLARGAFEAVTGLTIREVGFIDHPSIENFGSSPDGLLEDAGIEIKCPNTATHLDVICGGGGKIKRDYLLQMHVGMMSTGLNRWHFVDYDPRLPQPIDYYHTVIERDSELVTEIEQEVEKFLHELAEWEAALKEKINA